MHKTLISAALFAYIVTTFGVVKLASQPILKQVVEATLAVDLGDSLPYQLAVAVMVARTRDATILYNK